VIKKTGKKDRPVAVTAGCTIEWQEPSKCVVVRKRNGTPLSWSDGKTKRIMEMIRTVNDFIKYVESITDLLNLKAELVSGERYPTFRFK
jgi:hypothetical protein